MKMTEIIERVSKIYRDELVKTSDLYVELMSINRKIYEAEKDGWETITFAEYKTLSERKDSLETTIDIKKSYCRGISFVREMLMDLGFNTEVT